MALCGGLKGAPMFQMEIEGEDLVQCASSGIYSEE